MRWPKRVLALVAATSLALLVPVTSASADPSVTIPKGTTVVSFTFDDGWKDQVQAAEVLDENHMRGTFYVNSGQIGYPAYMNLPELQALAAKGHEIAGHTVDHPNLTKLPYEQAKAEICDDRATLIHLGFKAKDFAFPYGAGDTSTTQMVKSCGYVSARATSGLKSSALGCEGCPYANEMPPENDYWRVRTGNNDASLAALKDQITKAQEAGGGWVPLVFHHMCVDCAGKGKDQTSVKELSQLIEWMKTQPKIQTYTVDQMINGPYKPAVGQVIPRWANYGVVVEPTPYVYKPVVAFTVLGIGIGQGFVISTALIIGLIGVVAYRFGARKNRYHSAGH